MRNRQRRFQRRSAKGQRGFAIISLVIGAISLVAILLAVMANSRGPGTLASDSARPLAAGLLSQANNLISGFDVMMARNSLSPGSVTYDSTAGTGLFNSSVSALVRQIPPVDAVIGSTNWVYRSDKVTYTGVGATSTGSPEYSFMLPNVKKDVCQALNRQANGADLIYTSGLARTSLVASLTPAADTNDTTAAVTVSLAASGVAVPISPTVGCFQTSDGTPGPYYIAYAIALPQ